MVMAIVKTEHPYVTRNPDICGGEPIIAGTRITVRHIAVMYKAGDSVEDIVAGHPPLTAAQVHDAISYYLDHRDEIERAIEANKTRSVMRERDLVYVMGRGLMGRSRFERLPERENLTFYTWETLPRDWE
jgi:uncharacterized protein (DUF433 family)